VKSLPEPQDGAFSFFIKIVFSEEYQISIHVVLAGSLSLLAAVIVHCIKNSKKTKKENLEELLTLSAGNSRFYTHMTDNSAEEYHSVQDYEV
jgi:hypothetical protein